MTDHLFTGATACGPGEAGRRPLTARRYLPVGLLGVPGVLGCLGAVDLSVEPSLDWPLAPPLGVCCMDEVPPAAEDGAFGCAVRPPAAFWSRLQPDSTSARDAATIIRYFMNPPIKRAIRVEQTSGRCSIHGP